MNIQKHLLLILIFLLFLACETKPKKEFTENDITIIPKPVKTILGKGSFTLDKNTKIILSDKNQEQTINTLNSKLNITSGWKL
jgi:hexosaminidase